MWSTVNGNLRKSIARLVTPQCVLDLRLRDSERSLD
jgi:hypothetical protein